MKDLYAIIKKPLITERSAFLKDKYNKIIFQVAVNANKRDIKKAVEKIFNVHVMSVNTVNVQGKVKRFGKFFGKRNDWKKAIITLKEGDRIELLEGI